MDDKITYEVNGQPFETLQESAEHIAESMFAKRRLSTNEQLLENFRQSVIALQLAENAIVESYQLMVSRWQGEGNVPLKSARESVELFKYLSKVEAGLEGLREILEDALQLKMF